MGHQPLDDNHLVSHNSGLQYSYDAYGRRVRSKRPVGGQLRTVRHYLLPDGRPHFDKSITLIKPVPPQWSHAYLGDRLLARFDNAGNVEHVVTDHIGYPVATISYTGTIQWQPDPEPFGDVYAEQSVGPGHDPPIRYPGQWRVDPVLATTEPAFTTLYYNTHRWYNPTWGRYTQADPVGYHSADSPRRVNNLFVYAGQNPIRFVDPRGLVHWDCVYGGISAYAGVGFSLFNVSCVSECVDDERQVGSYIVKAVGAGGGFTAFPAEASSCDLEDSHSTADPSNLEGVFDIINLSASWGIGTSAYWVRQGDGWGRWPGAIGDAYGWGAGAFAARGSSVLWDSSVERCCPLPHPQVWPR